jgi:hypothetical protein
LFGHHHAAFGLFNRIEDKPHPMLLRQPVRQRGRQKIRLISVARQEIVSHFCNPLQVELSV